MFLACCQGEVFLLVWVMETNRIETGSTIKNFDCDFQPRHELQLFKEYLKDNNFNNHS